MIKLFSLVISLCIMVAACGDGRPDDVQFDSGKWKEGDPRVRYQMKADLIKRNILIGRTRDEIVDVLGSGEFEQEDYIQYEIDNGKLPAAITISPVYLTLIFDNGSQQVREVTVVDR
jgi:hypothetical protein